jgi:hypothetical protein
MFERKERSCRWNQHRPQEIEESAHMSLVDHKISELGHVSRLDSHYCSGSEETATPSNRLSCVDIIQGICLFSDDFYSDITLILIIILK